MTDCHCMTPPFDHRELETTRVGVDETNGRYGDVNIETCRACGRLWLTYPVTYEGFSGSGRWYRGLVSADLARSVTPETAVDVLNGLAWHFAGGRLVRSSGERQSGPIWVDLLG